MALIDFTPRDLRLWVNDETRLNAENMNELRLSIEDINTAIAGSATSSGIISELTNQHNKLEGTQPRTGVTAHTNLIGSVLYGKPINCYSDTADADTLIENPEIKDAVLESGLLTYSHNIKLHSEKLRTDFDNHQKIYGNDAIRFSSGSAISNLESNDIYGNRLVIAATNNLLLNVPEGKQFRVVSGNNDIITSIDGTLTLTDSKDVKLGATDGVILENVFLFKGSELTPVGNNKLSLGTSSKRVDAIYANTITSDTGTFTTSSINTLQATTATLSNVTADSISGFTLKGSIVPETASFDIGDPAVRINAVYSNDMDATRANVEQLVITSSAKMLVEQGIDDDDLVVYKTVKAVNEDVSNLTNRTDELSGNFYAFTGRVSEIGGEVSRISYQLDEVTAEVNRLQEGAGINVDEVSVDWHDSKLAIKGFADAEEGSQLIKADGKLQWVKPDTDTIEGLGAAIEGIERNIAQLQADLASLIIDDGEI